MVVGDHTCSWSLTVRGVLGRVFDVFGEALQEACCVRPIDDPVIEAQIERELSAKLDSVLCRSGAFSDTPDAKYRHFGRVDNRGEGVDAEHAEIRNRDRAATEVAHVAVTTLDALGQPATVPGAGLSGASFIGDHSGSIQPLVSLNVNSAVLDTGNLDQFPSVGVRISILTGYGVSISI